MTPPTPYWAITACPPPAPAATLAGPILLTLPLPASGPVAGTGPNRFNGHKRCVTRAVISPSGTGPYVLLSREW